MVDLGDDPDGDMAEQEAIALAWSLHNHHYSERCEADCPYRAESLDEQQAQHVEWLEEGRDRDY